MEFYFSLSANLELYEAECNQHADRFDGQGVDGSSAGSRMLLRRQQAPMWELRSASFRATAYNASNQTTLSRSLNFNGSVFSVPLELVTYGLIKIPSPLLRYFLGLFAALSLATVMQLLGLDDN
ncbi:MAG: hypothetical protein ABJU46_04330 [Paracoccaceae bacterium]